MSFYVNQSSPVEFLFLVRSAVRSSFLLTLPRALDMSIPKEVEGFIDKSFAENNKQLMSQIFLLVSQSVENLKCSHTEAAMDQLREIKKMKQEEPKSFNRKGNEFQYNPGLLGRPEVRFLDGKP